MCDVALKEYRFQVGDGGKLEERSRAVWKSKHTRAGEEHRIAVGHESLVSHFFFSPHWELVNFSSSP